MELAGRTDSPLFGGLERRKEDDRARCGCEEASYEQSLQIFVQVPCGRTIVVPVKLTEHVQTLVDKIEAREGVPADHQRIAFAGRLLQGSKTLACYNIEKESTVYVGVCLRGGMEPAPEAHAVHVVSSFTQLKCAWSGRTYYRDNTTGKLTFYPSGAAGGFTPLPESEQQLPWEFKESGLAGVSEDISDLGLEDEGPEKRSIELKDFPRAADDLLTAYNQTQGVKVVTETDWKKLNSTDLQIVIQTLDPRRQTGCKVGRVRDCFCEKDADVAVSYRWGMQLGEIYAALSSVCDPTELLWIDVLFTAHRPNSGIDVVSEVAPRQFQSAKRHVLLVSKDKDLEVMMRRGWLLYEVSLRMLVAKAMTELVNDQSKAVEVYRGSTSIEGDLFASMVTFDPRDKKGIKASILTRFGKGKGNPCLEAETEDAAQNFNNTVLEWLHLTGGMLVVEQLAAAGDHQGVLRESEALAHALSTKGKHQDCIRVRERQLEAAESLYGHDHLDVAKVLIGIGSAMQGLGQHAAALSKLEQALAIQFMQVGPGHMDVAKSLHRIGDLHRKLGKHEQAIPKFEEAIRIATKAQGPDCLDVAKNLQSIGSVLQKLGKDEEALAKFQECQWIKTKRLGLDHLDVAVVLGLVATVYQTMGKNQSALKNFEDAGKIRRKLLGEEHLEVARTEENVAGVLAIMGDVKRALPKYEFALRIKEKELGPEHLDVGSTLQNIGTVFGQQNDFKTALPPLERALVIKVKSLGPEHLDVARSLSNLGLIYSNLRNYDEAALKQMEALRIREKALGPEHALTKKAQERLASAQRKLQQASS